MALAMGDEAKPSLSLSLSAWNLLPISGEVSDGFVDCAWNSSGFISRWVFVEMWLWNSASKIIFGYQNCGDMGMKDKRLNSRNILPNKFLRGDTIKQFWE